MASQAVPKPVYEDVASCQAAMFEWAESFDSKDWDRLKTCLAPTLFLDYTAIMGKKWDAMPAEEFVGMASSPHFLGNARIKTQHLIGASKWTQPETDQIVGFHQMRVAHQKYADDELKEVLYQGHAHGNATTYYRNVGGEWKFAGLVPHIRWSEFDYEKIFEH